LNKKKLSPGLVAPVLLSATMPPGDGVKAAELDGVYATLMSKRFADLTHFFRA
jgi:hypothetical protein